MTLSLSCFDLPKQADIDGILKGLKNAFTIVEQPRQTVLRVYWDTFDWRLFTSNQQLQCDIVDKTHAYSLRRTDTNALITSLRTDKPLRMIDEFASSTMKKRLAPVMEMRALLPMVSLRSELLLLTVINSEQKIVVKLSIEKNQLINKSGKTGALLNRSMVLQPVRGYAKPFEAVTAYLRDQLHLTKQDQDAYSQALVKLKIHPGDYSSKPDVPLEPTMRADVATKKILSHLLHTMKINEKGTIDDIDSEFLHDFRVACRRSRSAIGQIKAVFPTRIIEPFKREFRWLQNITGPTRDLDVYLLKFDDYKNSVAEHFKSALQPLHDFLFQQQVIEHKKLVTALRTQRYGRLINRWQQFLQAPPPNRSSAVNASRPIREVASERIWKMYKRVIKEGEAITDQSPPDDLHELRKSCKKLRYLMEFFSQIYPPAELSQLTKALKHLQNNLGDYNDLHVQIASLENYGKQMMKHHPPPAETFLAMGALIESLDQKQHALRHEFHTQFKQFNAPQYHVLFQQLFTHQSSPAEVERQ